jgi:hypothetical protein
MQIERARRQGEDIKWKGTDATIVTIQIFMHQFTVFMSLNFPSFLFIPLISLLIVLLYIHLTYYPPKSQYYFPATGFLEISP